jgi:hypothetical protein
MTRLIRLLVPLSLCVLIAGAIAIACSRGRGEAPAAPRPDVVSPSGLPALGGPRVGNSVPIPDDAADDSFPASAAPPVTGQTRSVPEVGMTQVVFAASGQPGAAPPPGTAPPPSGPPQPGAPQPPAPSPPSQPGSGAPPSSPSQPGSGAPPGAPQPPSGSPGRGAAPGDAGVQDAGVPLPPIPDGGVRTDGGMQPILRPGPGSNRDH